ncbi:hypothetical protein E6C50_12530 [Flavobacterium supellecticarium]|uniref:Outer membrane protein beta-barrel domain-containing protein n=1 Tax=Flavobacterium supellecticarium TaxID=2565924 RepID=A0A4S3ZUU8_9FLAO|nr:outer membrane beta-barrel protein [Flavobacterium supellecticarium]THF49567.1 hypothetical protein E6C50_12530 [Flavobacterium supellecticarium]
MSERKNIDRLFQEKFKDFEAIPPKNAWNNILSELDGEKKKRRFIAPFWLKLSGIAAVFLLGFLTATYFISGPGTGTLTPAPMVNSGNGQDNTNTIHKDKNGSINDKNGIVPEPVNAVVTNENTLKGNRNASGFNSEAETTAQKEHQNHVPKQYKKQRHTHIAAANGRKKSNAVSADKLFAERNTNEGSSKNNGRFKQFNFKKNNTIANYIVMPKKDSSEIATIEEQENTLEKVQKEKFLVAEKKKIKDKEAKVSRWSVTALTTPIFFSSTSKGSPIDNQFASNSKDYENTMSYGLGLRYELNDKLTLRTGINRLAFEYNTDNIVYYESSNARSLQNVNQTKNNIQIQNKDYNNLATGPNGEVIEKMNSGSLTQRMGYIEVPMELSYKLIDKKFGVALIGGFSTLFLNQNKIDLVSPELNTTIGEANNLNNVHVSSNIGVGVKYRFAKAFEANFEPTFKYQLNMFSNDAGNFKPYLFGLYTGVSYRF